MERLDSKSMIRQMTNQSLPGFWNLKLGLVKVSCYRSPFQIREIGLGLGISVIGLLFE